MNRAACAIALALTVCVVTPALGRGRFAGRDRASASNSDDARRILIERQARHRTQSDEHLGELIVTAKNGKVRRKEWKSYREGSGAESNRLIRFLSPPEVRGVGYLLRQRPGKPPDEWLYLPSMKRERRIVPSDRQAAFVGTDFSYEDLEEFDEARYDAALLPEREVDGRASYAIELHPRRRSAYDKKILVLRKDDLSVLAVEYYRTGDRDVSKRLTLSNYQAVDGHPIAMRLDMQDLHKGSSTVVLLHDVLLNRPQPPDRYTIENLSREGDDRGARPEGTGTPRRSRDVTGSSGPLEPDRQPHRVSPALTGYLEGKIFANLSTAGGHDPRTEGWGDLFVRYSSRLGFARISAAVRAEQSSSARAGPLVFDPADRQLQRSPLSIRELSLVLPILSGVDLQIGRFHLAWGQGEELSPADAFLPRDASDPLTEERLPLWGAQLRGERGGVRFEMVAAPTTTPWRLPALDGTHSPLWFENIFFVDLPSSVPRRGFEAARVAGTVDGWDVGVWARTGVRPAPILEPHLNLLQTTPSGTFIPVSRRFANERGFGTQLSHDYLGWLVDGEVSVLRSSDKDLGNAVIWTVSCSHAVRNGLFVGTFAMNAIKPPVEPLLLFDRALLPAFLLGLRQAESWGTWRLGWLGTFDRVGGVLTMEATRDLTGVVKLTGGLDLPHGASVSPARAFGGDKRVRVVARWDW